VNKSELVEAVANGAGVSKAEAEGVLTTLFDTVKAQLAAGDSVAWPGFGKFATTARQARVGRNPQTGASVKIAASTAAKFTSSSLLKEHLNPKGAAKRAATRKTAASKATASKATASKAPAKRASATTATASTSAATKAPAKATAAAKKAPAKKATGTAKKATAAKRTSR
jgi:DNA-binding protein HU-beta